VRDNQISFKYLFSIGGYQFSLNSLTTIVLDVKFQPTSGAHSPAFDAHYTQILDNKFEEEGKFFPVSTYIN
jgi:hypothetical protein